MTTPAADAIALPRPCEQCTTAALLRVGGLCPACIGHLGLHDPEGHRQWHARLARELGKAA